MKNKKAVPVIALALVLVVVVSAFEWMFRKGPMEQKSFQAGAASIISEVVGRTLESCDPINLFVGEQKVDLVNVACLGQPSEPVAAQSDPTAAAPAPVEVQEVEAALETAPENQ